MIGNLPIGLQPECVILSILACVVKRKGKNSSICEFRAFFSPPIVFLDPPVINSLLMCQYRFFQVAHSFMPVFDPSRDSWERYATRLPSFFIEISLVWAVMLKHNCMILSAFAVDRRSLYSRFFSWGRRSEMPVMSLATCNSY